MPHDNYVDELKHLVEKLEKELERKNEELLVKQREISSLKEMLEMESFSDKLTGFYNKKAFESIILHKKNRSDRSRKPFSLIMLDINDFGYINDTYGHEAGDKVLINFADNLRKILRSEDAISRWGEDEFIVLLSDTSFEEAKIVSSKIGFFVKDWEVHLDNTIINYTQSKGIAQYKLNEKVSSLLERVEVNMNADKQKYKMTKK